MRSAPSRVPIQAALFGTSLCDDPGLSCLIQERVLLALKAPGS